ncbi:hypothetical protein CYLTODRAFT_425697 [Cylindrobasidium torrendii FP15055 ss-10]|uniref:DUF323 domain-containing protein n=1 Tax=Cylindrobasidium torrendii FP15055 ss-10 TaxID=1314674 RepID=A0A0D7B320_9AGAR|nr:hypothetical protein CYLTODRAFT_425697 [Cylindrobasidium torrendii FP15055 ss-10]
MSPQILDIHVDSPDDNGAAMRQEIRSGLQAMGQKTFPTMLLYDNRGLRIYDDITTKASEYYLFGAEEEILKTKADDIVRTMHASTGVSHGQVVLELGSGSLRKTSHILRSLANVAQPASSQTPPITYYALDLEQRELQRTLEGINHSDLGPMLEGKVSTRGMWGTYDDGLKYVQSGGLNVPAPQIPLDRTRFSRDFVSDERDRSPHSDSQSSAADDSPPSTPGETQPPLHILFLGSSLGNFPREDGAAFLRSLPLRPGAGDTLLLGLDHDNEKGVIEKAYNDSQGITRDFILNGLKAAGRVFGDEKLFEESNWEYVNRYDPKTRIHEAFLQCKADHQVKDPSDGSILASFVKHELVKMEQSVKFSDTDAYTLFSESGLRPVQRWTDSTGRYSLWLLERPTLTFPLLSSAISCNRQGLLVPKTLYSSSTFGVPSPQEWENLWALWDLVTRTMIPPSMLFQKPIDLRHICLFYLGHIPTFLDIHLTRLLKEQHTEPENFKDIFERGIDPNVDDPTQCHPHSEVPSDENDWPNLSSILGFQSRVRQRVLDLYKSFDTGARTLDRKTGRVLFMTYEHEALHVETLLYMLLQRAGTGTLPPLGFSPPDWPSLKDSWATALRPTSSTVKLGPAKLTLGHDDIESEDATATDAREHEYGWDNESPKRTVEVGEFRIEWRPVTNGEYYKFIKEKGGNLPASWVEQDGEVQVRTLFGPVSMDTAWEWPVIAMYDDLSRYAIVKGGRLPTETELRLFYDLFDSGYEGGSNVGFRNWHPTPATTGADSSGKGSNGGVWEWTSTVFDAEPGFQASLLYPGYSQDFFDGAHNVVLGGSYATIPRIAGRRSVRNWYQRNYPYAWVGGRVAYDVQNCSI